jgi:hypothetical protein
LRVPRSSVRLAGLVAARCGLIAGFI